MKNKNGENDYFNIYYINFSKVYEISMMLNNIIASSIHKEKSTSSEKSSSIGGSASSMDILSSINASLSAQLSNKKSDASKMIETLDVITTKSVLLKNINKRSKVIKSFSDQSEGDLIKINNIELDIVNIENLREFKLFRSDALKGFQVDGIEVSNIFNSMLKDYSYILSGKLNDSNDVIAIKIPMELENEFENKYTVDDLVIGKVSIIGIYKGIVDIDNIKINTINYLANMGEKSTKQNNHGKFIRSSVDRLEKAKEKLNGLKNYHYIDAIAIVQNISFQEDLENNETQIPWYKKLLKKLRGNNND
ncbi:hypothetical protein MKY41_13480 [Sporosarcina sp. FSL W7-1349]|uniref:hypothetical protein n=1 Tax=Sporosarcina sp. FSL W7-1349 TaxID=2921561 RepID=UPI0030FC33E4